MCKNREKIAFIFRFFFSTNLGVAGAHLGKAFIKIRQIIIIIIKGQPIIQ